MSDEEDDYMSEKFLSGLQDVRPSLIHNRAKKRQIVVEIRHKEQNKKRREQNQKVLSVDNDRLQAALSKPLEQENRGFKLLAKMGYKPGQALGKSVESAETSASNTISKRLIEPIGITMKTDRQGLGRETALRELNERREKIREHHRMRRKADGEISFEDFRRRTNQKYEDKFVLNALKRCQVTCQNLDLEMKLEKPEMPWFWPEIAKETDEEEAVIEEDEEEFSNQEMLEMLTNYVRTSYLFCYWCGVRFNDEQDLKDNCPGLTKDDH